MALTPGPDSAPHVVAWDVAIGTVRDDAVGGSISTASGLDLAPMLPAPVRLDTMMLPAVPIGDESGVAGGRGAHGDQDQGGSSDADRRRYDQIVGDQSVGVGRLTRMLRDIAAGRRLEHLGSVGSADSDPWSDLAHVCTATGFGCLAFLSLLMHARVI